MIKTKPEAKWIEPVLKSWLVVNHEFVIGSQTAGKKDCLYWYNERANVGAFAAAIWKAEGEQGLALEEYSAKKGSGENESTGRVDLYFSYGRETVIAEAKMEWIKLSGRVKADFTRSATETMHLADNDIKNSRAANPVSKHALSLSFIVPYWKEKYDAGSDLIKIYDELDLIDCSFYAVYKNTGVDIVSTKHNVCNLVILIGNFL